MNFFFTLGPEAGIQRKEQVGMCGQRRLKSVCAATQSDQNFNFTPEKVLDPLVPIEQRLRSDCT